MRADRLLASPLARARQTAELAVAAGLAPRLELAEALAPGGDPLPLIGTWLAELGPSGGSRRRLALVGHEPDLGLLVARLIGAVPGSIDLRKAGLAVLRLPGPATSGLAGRARLRLLLAPRLLLAGS
jgi:phosphohistidine phosphatase